MPTLQFKGRQAVANHHLVIPYHTLDEVPELDYPRGKSRDHLIVEGDNLLALKALLPQYLGGVKCIYIDPPYNTGQEGWVYNDKVSSPLIKEWLKREVGRDDLTRHDKWLCMMMPRLKLLRELLTDDGVIFISIDDNEVHHLRALGDDIFGEENFVAIMTWETTKGAQGLVRENKIVVNSEFILCYAKEKSQFAFNGLDRTEADGFSNPDNDLKGPWKRQYLQRFGQGFKKRKIINPANKMVFEFETPYTLEKINEWIKRGEIIFPKTNDKYPARKEYLSQYKNKKQLVSHLGIYATKSYTEKMQTLFDKQKIFNNPKPDALIEFLISQSTTPDSLVLDSFAGSGTTMQAVMDLNQKDGGNRKCILVQMTESTQQAPSAHSKNICRDITRERIKRAIEKHGYETGFKYLKVGGAIDEESLLAGQLPTFEQLAEYVYYLCTGERLRDKAAMEAQKTFS